MVQPRAQDYNAFREDNIVAGTRHRPELLMTSLTAVPLELDICAPTCATHYAPRLGFSLPPAFPLSRTALQPGPNLPSCGARARAGTLGGAYLPTRPIDQLYPPFSLPYSYHPSTHSRTSTGYNAFVPAECAWTHAGTRFADHAPCVAREDKQRVLFVGDSHARAAFDIVTVRLEGEGAVASSSVKLEVRNATVGSLFMVRRPPSLDLLAFVRGGTDVETACRSSFGASSSPRPDFPRTIRLTRSSLARRDPFLVLPLSCELVDGLDAIVVSAVRPPLRARALPPRADLVLYRAQGTHMAAFNCPATSEFVSFFEARLAAIPALVEQCRRSSSPSSSPSSSSTASAPPKLVLLNMPVQHQLLHDHDCRTGPRLSHWNGVLGRVARKEGWQVVDVEMYSRPNAIDQRIMDGIHCASSSLSLFLCSRACARGPLRAEVLMGERCTQT